MTSDENISVITEASGSTAPWSNPHSCQEDRHYAYKSLIRDISDSLHDRDVKCILWRYKEELPAHVQQISSGLNVLDHLHEKGKLSKWRIEDLKELMTYLNRKDLEERVEQFHLQYPAGPERHRGSSLPTNTSNPRIPVMEKLRASTYPRPEPQLNSLRTTVTMHPQQESGFSETAIDPGQISAGAGDSIMSPGSEFHSQQNTAMNHYPVGPHSEAFCFQTPQPVVMSHEPLSIPVEHNYYAETQRPMSRYKFQSSGATTPGSISASSFDSMLPTMPPPHSNRSQHSSVHTSFEKFSHPSSFSLSSGDSHFYGHPHPSTPGPSVGHPWYNSYSSLPSSDQINSPYLPRYNPHSHSVMTMPVRRIMTIANPTYMPIHSRKHIRRHTINSSTMQPNQSYGELRPPQHMREMHQPRPRRAASYEYPELYYDQPYQQSADDVYMYDEYHPNVQYQHSHSQPSNGAHQHMSPLKHPKLPPPAPHYTAPVVSQSPEFTTSQKQTQKQKAWGSGHTSEHSNRSSIPLSKSMVSNSKWGEEHYRSTSVDKQSETNHYTTSTSTEHDRSEYVYESDCSEDSDELLVYNDKRQPDKDLLEGHPNQVILRNKDRKSHVRQSSKRYSLQPVSQHNSEELGSTYDKRRSLRGSWIDGQPHMLSEPSEDTLVGSPSGSMQVRSLRSRLLSKGSSEDIPEEKYDKRSEKPRSKLLNNGAMCANNVPSKKQRIPKYLFTRSRSYKPQEELVWRVKRDKLNKMIYKHKDNKYIACNDKIELETPEHIGPRPKLILRLHPYGVEEDRTENVTLEVRIERSKKNGPGSMHSSTEVEVCVRSEAREEGKVHVIGEEHRVKESARLSFFFIKGLISHQELKKSRSEYIEIKATANLVLPL